MLLPQNASDHQKNKNLSNAKCIGGWDELKLTRKYSLKKQLGESSMALLMSQKVRRLWGMLGQWMPKL